MRQNDKRSIGQRWDELQPSKTVLAWTCVATVAATLVVGFTWGRLGHRRHGPGHDG